MKGRGCSGLGRLVIVMAFRVTEMLSSPARVAGVSTVMSRVQMKDRSSPKSLPYTQPRVASAAWGLHVERSGEQLPEATARRDSRCLCIVSVRADRDPRGKLMAGGSESGELNTQGRLTACLSKKLPRCRNFCFERKQHLI